MYLLGGAGVGKSSVMSLLMEGWVAGPYTRWTEREMFGHSLVKGDELGAYLGRLRPDYPGTDSLCLSVAPQALLWLEAVPLLGLSMIFGEGWRLGHRSFLLKLSRVTSLTVVLLTATDQAAEERRAHRGGKTLAPTFCASAASRAANTYVVCRSEGVHTYTVDTTHRTPEQVAELVRLEML